MLAKALLGLGALVGLGFLFMNDAKADSGPTERLIDASERNHPSVAQARTIIRNALAANTRASVLGAASQVLQLGMPRTAQNVTVYAATMEAPATTTPAPGLPGGAPASSLPGASTVPPADVINAMAAALATNDASQMERLADELERRGFATQAADLRAAAKITRDAQAAMAAAGIQLPPASSMATSAGQPAIPSPAAVGTVDPKQLLAGKVVLTFNNGKEDKELVRLFQTQERSTGRYAGVIDGLYGPKSAVALMAYNFVPPRPKYWPKNQAEAKLAKDAYRKLLLARAQTDRPRADEWTRAAQV